MKKRGFLVILLVFVCLLSVACGKVEEDKKESGKTDNTQAETKSNNAETKSNKNVSTLTCTSVVEDENVTMIIEQDKKTYKLTKVAMSMSLDKSAYEGLADSDVDLEKILCVDENNNYKSCKATSNKNTVTVDIEFKEEAYEKELKNDGSIDKLDANTLNELKKEAEKDGGKCTIS